MSNYPSTEEIQQQREDELSLSSTMMLQKEPSLIEERHNIDVTENTTEHSTTEIDDDDDQYGCFVAISPVVSMSHLVINNDAITGSTEIQLKQLDVVQTQRSNNNTATTPPVSPVSSSPLSSPNNTTTTSSCLMKTGGGTTSCQRRGRFLIWPVTVGPLPLGRSSSSHSK